jgi:hypothetical protein
MSPAYASSTATTAFRSRARPSPEDPRRSSASRRGFRTTPGTSRSPTWGRTGRLAISARSSGTCGAGASRSSSTRTASGIRAGREPTRRRSTGRSARCSPPPTTFSTRATSASSRRTSGRGRVAARGRSSTTPSTSRASRRRSGPPTAAPCSSSVVTNPRPTASSSRSRRSPCSRGRTPAPSCSSRGASPRRSSRLWLAWASRGVSTCSAATPRRTLLGSSAARTCCCTRR